MKLNLTQRLSCVFAVLLLACSGASAWLQIRANDMREKEVVQALSRDLAAHIASSTPLMDANGLRPDAVRRLFGQLMGVNPSVEVYLLDNAGHIEGDDAPPGHVKRTRVDLAPVQRFIAGEPLPILGDDPRSIDARKVFSAAPLQRAGQPPSGYVYVVLLGEAHDRLAARVDAGNVLRTTLWSMAVVALLGLVAGLIAFSFITRPLRRLTDAMRRFDANGVPDTQPPLPRPAPGRRGDDLAVLESAFAQMADRIGEQWRALTRQDQQRRELITNISHDLRTPLTSLHGYLETLSLKADTLADSERRRYLSVALAQSTKVGRLAQALFELARLESGSVQAEREPFSLVDLVQDVFQKFELAAQSRGVALQARIPPRVPAVSADLAMIERVLTNLLDNALRHTPQHGAIEVALTPRDDRVVVTVSDTGAGIPLARRAGLFQRPQRPVSGGTSTNGGLGLLIVHRMLALNGSDIRLVDRDGRGAVFEFALAIAQPAPGDPQ
ncbi:HAMP domain-containing sensor histidine kinase [Burkholderia vietnamiensis]|uniref:sensor histidine kinase n=1 Tax=Burkholderia vietnamiensis TaxID=60552 RepID=UPI001CF23DC7|nr:HAMP domain-containing sensor histidine kinase [Burkholderia vietnamiensis]MCA8182062.1 HAMP domain-containing histidine kinase [Burkholderia vietnamiensis]MDN7553562.1 HAMP domain-containing sensor histidine kinase [Burkholderia vietnamiensis]HDR8921313.1 HAMP domain-containing histidine kinase [Burkholderia vietnamiensis]HDR8980568.1 HAMP domain-containing histidine kinase [Burkholderia vietnamiensis]HDR9091789.1 HAMP domain-containing histidine kinase [Burkholderia vietnamiensis]